MDSLCEIVSQQGAFGFFKVKLIKLIRQGRHTFMYLPSACLCLLCYIGAFSGFFLYKSNLPN